MRTLHEQTSLANEEMRQWREKDERRGLPSASGIERIMLCPGSWNLEKTCPEPSASDDAASGTKIHTALAGETVALNDDERETFEMCKSIEKQIVEKLGFDSPEAYIQSEMRLWNRVTIKQMFSGKFDRSYSIEPRYLIIDFKTGRNIVTAAEKNYQMRALAVLARNNIFVKTSLKPLQVFVAIIQPWCSPQFTIAEYSLADVLTADNEITSGLERAMAPDAPRIPSTEACRYCKALAICPEAQKEAELAVTRLESRQLSQYTPDERGLMLDWIVQAESVLERKKAELRGMIESDPESVTGWKLQPGNEVREIVHKGPLFFAFKESLGMDMNTFMRACKVSLTELKRIHKERSILKGKEAEAQFDALLEPFVEIKQNRPSLKKT